MNKLISISLLALSLASCSTRADGNYRRSEVGTVVGAVVGGAAGSAFGKGSGQDLAIGLGAIGGAYMGNDMGHATDRMQLQNKTRSSDGVFEHLPDETYKAWVNPNTGSVETLRPVKTMPSEKGESNCRLFQSTRSGGYSAMGMVCRDSYGRWMLMD